MKISAYLGSISFVALLIASSMATITPAAAQHREGCRDRIHQAEWRLERAVERFGRRSGAAREARHHLERTRDRCSRDHRRDRDRDEYDGPPRRDGWRH